MNVKIEQVASNACLIRFGDQISAEIASAVQQGFHLLKQIPALLEVTPSYTTILVTYDVRMHEYKMIRAMLQEALIRKSVVAYEEEIITVDVYYGVECGPDLERISRDKNLSLEAIIKIHSAPLYDVYAMGFLPGFAFLGTVDDAIATPRLSSPRPKVPKGSVAVAENQSAVYPVESAGGWNLIGKTAMELFDPSSEGLSPLGIGKKVRFNSVSKEEYLKQGGVL